ncbi:hypothetical protein ACFSHR_26710 [Azotobacter chroococcum]
MAAKHVARHDHLGSRGIGVESQHLGLRGGNLVGGWLVAVGNLVQAITAEDQGAIKERSFTISA